MIQTRSIAIGRISIEVLNVKSVNGFKTGTWAVILDGKPSRLQLQPAVLARIVHLRAGDDYYTVPCTLLHKVGPQFEGLSSNTDMYTPLALHALLRYGGISLPVAAVLHTDDSGEWLSFPRSVHEVSVFKCYS
jgi:hypothetical protein